MKASGRIFVFLLSGLVLFGGDAKADRYDAAAGQVTAAAMISAKCKGLSTIGAGITKDYLGSDESHFETYRTYVEAAMTILKDQGFRRNPLATRLFYASEESLVSVAEFQLAERGVDPLNTKSICSFGKKVAGTDDPIGQFLVRK